MSILKRCICGKERYPGKGRRYYKDLCGEHGRMEKREYYVVNDIGWLRDRHPAWERFCGIGACVFAVTEKERV